MENFRICSSSLEVKMSIHMLETIIDSDITTDIMNKMFSYIYTPLLYQLNFYKIPKNLLKPKRTYTLNFGYMSNFIS